LYFFFVRQQKQRNCVSLSFPTWRVYILTLVCTSCHHIFCSTKKHTARVQCLHFAPFFFCSNYKFVNMLIFIHVSIKLFYRVLPNDFKVINMALSYVFIKRTRVICYWLGHMRPICASDFKKKKLLASSRFRVFKYLRVLVINSISFL